MATKVIISGGYADLINSENSKFFAEILNDTATELNILLVLFAKEEDGWDEKSKGVIAQFELVKGNKRLNYDIANHPDIYQQVKNADIVYIRGGDTPMLLLAMQKHTNFKAWLNGKIVAGESAGTYLLSTCFYSKTAGGVFEGLGLLPIKTICHYEGKNEEKLDECPKNLEKVLLKDFEYKVYYK